MPYPFTQWIQEDISVNNSREIFVETNKQTKNPFGKSFPLYFSSEMITIRSPCLADVVSVSTGQAFSTFGSWNIFSRFCLCWHFRRFFFFFAFRLHINCRNSFCPGSEGPLPPIYFMVPPSFRMALSCKHLPRLSNSNFRTRLSLLLKAIHHPRYVFVSVFFCKSFYYCKLSPACWHDNRLYKWFLSYICVVYTLL